MSNPINDMCDPCNPDRLKTLCDGDCTNNIWFVKGQCRLDQLTYEQVYYILQHNRSAKRDLLRATSNPALVYLAHQTQLIMDEKDETVTQRLINNPSKTLPFYTLMKGRIDGGF